MESKASVTQLKIPPHACELCGGKIGSVFYDARIPSLGTWGNICHSCFRTYRCHLGIGCGQKYRRGRASGLFVKVIK